MNKRIKKLWIAALRSGKYQQGLGRLRGKDGDGNARFCCLGVLCEIAVAKGVIVNYTHSDGGLPVAVCDWAGVSELGRVLNTSGSTRYQLSDKNDAGRTFKEIAKLIGKDL